MFEQEGAGYIYIYIGLYIWFRRCSAGCSKLESSDNVQCGDGSEAFQCTGYYRAPRVKEGHKC